jgi:excisionase family DNA binding protein
MQMSTNKDLMSIGSAAKYLGVSIDTLRRWDASKKLQAIKLPSGHRYYDRSTLERFREDLFSLAKIWAASAVAPEISKDYYSDTQDRFRARLEHMAMAIAQKQETSDLASLITAMAGEIGNNSFDHNLGTWPDIPGIFFAYDISKRIIVLADRGVGIKTTLKRVRPDIKDDIDALKIAMTERVSGRSPEQRGNGLKFVSNIANENSLEVSLQSGTAVAIIGKEKGAKLKIKLADQNIIGVVAKIEY